MLYSCTHMATVGFKGLVVRHVTNVHVTFISSGFSTNMVCRGISVDLHTANTALKNPFERCLCCLWNFQPLQEFMVTKESQLVILVSRPAMVRLSVCATNSKIADFFSDRENNTITPSLNSNLIVQNDYWTRLFVSQTSFHFHTL